MNPEQEIHLAVKEKDVKRITELLDNNVDINCLFYGLTPLQNAVNLGYEDISIFLIEKGADFHKLHHKTDGCPFERAIKKRLPKVLRTLLDRGADADIILSDGNPAIFTAIAKGYTDILSVLIDGKADVNKENKDGESALYVCCRDGKVNICRLLIDAGAQVDYQCPAAGNQSPLIIATANEHVDVVRLLLKSGSDVNLKDEDSWTALWHAYSNSDEDMMTLLLRSGANKDITDADGRTLLDDATEMEDESVVELLQRFTQAWT